MTVCLVVVCLKFCRLRTCSVALQVARACLLRLSSSSYSSSSPSSSSYNTSFLPLLLLLLLILLLLLLSPKRQAQLTTLSRYTLQPNDGDVSTYRSNDTTDRVVIVVDTIPRPPTPRGGAPLHCGGGGGGGGRKPPGGI